MNSNLYLKFYQDVDDENSYICVCENVDWGNYKYLFKYQKILIEMGFAITQSNAPYIYCVKVEEDEDESTSNSVTYDK